MQEVAPSVLCGHADDENLDLLLDPRSSRPAFAAAVVLLGNQLPVPAKQRVRRNDGVELPQGRSAKLLGLGSQEPTLLVGEGDTPSPRLELLFEDAVLRKEVLEGFALFSVQPCSQSDDEDRIRRR